MSFFKKMFYLLRGFLFPCGCALCGGSLLDAHEMRIGLCTQCRASLQPSEGHKCHARQSCRLCGKPLISEKETCLSCRNGGTHSYDRLWVIFPYTGKYRDLLASYKFGKNLSLADFFAQMILELIENEPLLKDACIVPVPPRPGKIKASGWDQVDHLVKRLERLMLEKSETNESYGRSLNISRCLTRRKSGVQKRLGRQDRIHNLKGRIIANADVPKIALIIDDVITTGSTLEVCAVSLKENGAQKVYGLCLFYD